MKVALVYDRANKIGGAERVLEVLHEIFPEAPLYTSLVDFKKAPWAVKFQVKTSFLQKIKFVPHEILPNLMPLAFKSFNLTSYDLVISVTSAEAKYLKLKRPTKHICLCLTPTRYLWNNYFGYLDNPGFGEWSCVVRTFFLIFAPLMRMRDFEEANKVDEFLAISKEVRARIWKYYRRKAQVVCPPVSFGERTGGIGRIGEIGGMGEVRVVDMRKKDYFLIVSRLVPYKKIDLAIRVFNGLSEKTLIVVGVGSEETRLKKIAQGNVIFTGLVGDKELATLYNNCEALIFPGIEDFGLTSLEAQAFGKPVICNARGGARETIVIGETGEVFHDERELKNIISNFDKRKYKAEDFQRNRLRFSKEEFKKQINLLVN